MEGFLWGGLPERAEEEGRGVRVVVADMANEYLLNEGEESGLPFPPSEGW